MGSKKRSAQMKQIAQFKASFEDTDLFGGADDPFAKESQRMVELAQAKEDALREKACESKNRYWSRTEAEEAIASCAEYGTTGLHCYKCSYCGGWHLTSHPHKK